MIFSAIVFWQPIASRVIMQPDISKKSNIAGMAVISFDFESVLY